MKASRRITCACAAVIVATTFAIAQQADQPVSPLTVTQESTPLGDNALLSTGPIMCTGDADCYFAAVNAANGSGGLASDFLDVCDYHYCNNGVCDSCERRFGNTVPVYNALVQGVDVLCGASGFVNYCFCPSADSWDARSVDNRGPSGPPLGVDDISALVRAFGGAVFFDCPIPDPMSNCDLEDIVPPLDQNISENANCGPACFVDADCADQSYCNGEETCVEGRCKKGNNPCSPLACSEDTDRCGACVTDADCGDGRFCNGEEVCDVMGQCTKGDPPCPSNIACDELNNLCSGSRRLFLVPAGMNPLLATSGQDVAIDPAPGAVVSVEAYLEDPETRTHAYEFAMGCTYASAATDAGEIQFVDGSMAIDDERSDYYFDDFPSFIVLDEGQCMMEQPCTDNNDCWEDCGSLCLPSGFCSITPARAGAVSLNPGAPAPPGRRYIANFQLQIPIEPLIGRYTIRPICPETEACTATLTRTIDSVPIEQLPVLVNGLEIDRRTVCCDGTAMTCQQDVFQSDCPSPAVWLEQQDCDADCNDNGLADICDIVIGNSNDCNANDIPDECETQTCTRDCDCYLNATAGGPDICDPTSLIDICDYTYCDIPQGQIEGNCTSCRRRYGNTCDSFAGFVQTNDILCAVAGFGNYCACPNADLVNAKAPGCQSGIFNANCKGPSGSPLGTDDIIAVVGSFGGANPYPCSTPNDDTCDDNPPPSAGGCGPASLAVDGPSAAASSHAVHDVVVRRSSSATLQIVPRERSIRADGQLAVDIFVTDVEGLIGYEFGLSTIGGKQGALSLHAVNVDTDRNDYVFDGLANFPAIDEELGRIGGVAMDAGVTVSQGKRAYLGTFTFTVPDDARGAFSLQPSTEFVALFTSGGQQSVGTVDDAIVFVTGGSSRR